ncbi:MAG: arsenate reductase family protein [Sulfurospirillaceae bacterium]|nr:arsenate reductase family protein [Sulfurospirillaceae bacterium]
MNIVYGIKTCGSVKKALNFFKEHNIDYEFVDFKKESVDIDKIQSWLKKTTVDKLFNKKGTTYRKLGLKELSLGDEDKIKWLAKENMLIKRPVIEYKDQIIVGFDENQYIEVFI